MKTKLKPGTVYAIGASGCDWVVAEATTLVFRGRFPIRKPAEVPMVGQDGKPCEHGLTAIVDARYAKKQELAGQPSALCPLCQKPATQTDARLSGLLAKYGVRK